MTAGLPRAGLQHGLRGRTTAAELREGSEAAAECRMKKGLQYPRCLLYTALEAAQNRRQICLKVDTQPADAQVRLTALSGTGQALREPRSLPARQSVPREQVLFGTPSTDPQQFRLSVEHPRFLPQERLIDFSQTMLQSVSIKLDRVQSPPFPLQEVVAVAEPGHRRGDRCHGDRGRDLHQRSGGANESMEHVPHDALRSAAYHRLARHFQLRPSAERRRQLQRRTSPV